MTTRLVCRSAPLPTKHIARRMTDDLWSWWVEVDPTLNEAEERRMGHGRVRRIVISEPQNTDVGQCWSEEVFSMLEGER